MKTTSSLSAPARKYSDVFQNPLRRIIASSARSPEQASSSSNLRVEGLSFLVLASLLANFVSPAVAQDKFVIRDVETFQKLVDVNTSVTKLATGMRFVEGPVWMPGINALIFSDIPANQLKSWDPDDGLSTYREPSGHANGNTVDQMNRLITAEHGGRRISRTLQNETVETVVDQYQGKKFNSPNDVVVKSDGTIWFTDPDYGLAGREKELTGNWVFRHDPKSGETVPVVKDFIKPNGLCFSPDEKKLYIADSGKPRHIRVFHVLEDNSLDGGTELVKLDSGAPDGIRCDKNGFIFSSAGDGVHIVHPDGSLVGKILVEEAPANLCFGGADGHTLFITARTSLYSIPVKTTGTGME